MIKLPFVVREPTPPQDVARCIAVTGCRVCPAFQHRCKNRRTPGTVLCAVHLKAKHVRAYVVRVGACAGRTTSAGGDVMVMKPPETAYAGGADLEP